MAVAVETPWSSVVRQSNDLMRKLAANEDPGETLPFFCECPSPGCFAAVWMTISAYDAARAEGAPIEPRSPQRPPSSGN